jgi:hypothetical protein
VKDRISPDVELVWDSFHQAVNMTSQELRAWLLTDASGQDAFPASPDLELPRLGRKVVDLLGKRKVDLTDEDADVMAQVTDYVNGMEGSPPPDGAANSGWRQSLMTVGHDPLRP